MFRCDSSVKSGTGHVTRSFALAEIFALNGWEVTFCGDFHEPSWIPSFLRQIENLKIIKVNKALDSQDQYDVIVFDSYTFNSDEQTSLANLGKFILSIVDDISEKIEAELYVSSLPVSYLKNFHGTNNHLFGPEFALVRKAFLEFNSFNQNNSKNLIRPTVGIFSGGAAKKEFLEILIPQILPKLANWDLRIYANAEDFPMSKYNSDHISIKETSFDFYNDLVDVNLVIATASVSSWEFLCMDIPLAIYGLYENQKNTYDFLSKKDYASGIGFTVNYKEFELDVQIFEQVLNRILRNESFMENHGKIVDGLGPARIYGEILKRI